MTIVKEDIRDRDIIDADELISDGYSVYLTSTIISTTNSTGIVLINLPSDGEGILTGKDHLVNPPDRVYLIGTSGGLADGYYIVNEVLTDTSFSVNETISDSTGGIIYFMHPVGAGQIGFDPTGLSNVTSHTIQGAIRELSLNATGISENQHTALRQLIHFISEGPATGFASGAYKEILPEAAPFPTSVIWYTSPTKTNKIVEKTIVYNLNKTPHTITWKMYDASNVLLATVIDTIAYNGIFEVNRTRTIA
jgi:hypothetical protein